MFRQTTTALGMRFQKVRIHGNTPLNNAFNFARPTRLIYGLRKDLVKLWIKDNIEGRGVPGLSALPGEQEKSSFWLFQLPLIAGLSAIRLSTQEGVPARINCVASRDLDAR
jgi:hypothetical protein